MSSVSERLREERERLGYSQTDFAKLAEIHRRSQVNYESGESSPDANYLERISSVGVDVGFVITGQRSSKEKEKLGLNLPMFDHDFSEQLGALELSEKWLILRNLTTKTVSFSVSYGDLMEPLLNNGEYFLFNRADTALRSGKVFVIRLMESKESVVCYVQLLPDGGARLSFENKKYPPIDLTKADLIPDAGKISVMGSVVMSLREW